MPETAPNPDLVLVTGAGGFIGRHVCRLLADEGVPFVGILRPGARPPVREPADWPAGSFVQVDAADPDAVREAVRATNPGRIVNLAAVGTAPGEAADVERFIDVNVRMPLQLYQSMAKGCSLVQVGSMTQYQSSDRPLAEDSATRDFASLYSWSKNAADLGLDLLSRRGSGQPKTCIRARIFGVIGPGEAAHRLIPSIIAACRGGTAALLSDGAQVRDILHVEDVAAALVHLSRQPALGGCAVNVGRGHGRSVRWIAESVATLLDCRSRLVFGALPRRPGEAEKLVANVERLGASGWRPRWSIEESLARAVAQMTSASDGR